MRTSNLLRIASALLLVLAGALLDAHAVRSSNSTTSDVTVTP